MGKDSAFFLKMFESYMSSKRKLELPVLNDSIAVRAANKRSRILAPSPDVDEQSTLSSISVNDRNYTLNEDSSISFFLNMI